MKLFEVELELKGLTLIYVPSRNNWEPPEPTEAPATCLAYIDVAAETEDEAKRLAVKYASLDDAGMYEVDSVEYSGIWENPAGCNCSRASVLGARYTEPDIKESGKPDPLDYYEELRDRNK